MEPQDGQQPQDGQVAQEEVRARVHALWAGVADRWADHADYVDERGAVVTDAMVDRVALRPGDHALELACGPGSVGIEVARRLAPGGTVVLSDVAAEMVALAAARAEHFGVGNVRTAVLDLEAIDEPDAGFDVVVCREGLMFAFDPAQAVAEMHRVLRPGGRMAVSVWASAPENPWLGLVFAAVTEVTGFPVPPPGVPGPFSLGDPVQVDGLLRSGGFADVVVEPLAVPMRARDFEEWWRRTSAMAGPLASVLAGLPDDTIDAVTRTLRTSVAPHIDAGGLDLPGLALLATGAKP